MCNKTRILDFRAANKYPLGCYRYGGKLEKVRFDCSRLVDTDCNVPEDIVLGLINDMINLLVLKKENGSPPTSGILVKRGNILEETSRKKVVEIFVQLKFCSKGDKIQKLPTNNLLAEYNSTGNIKIGLQSRRGITSLVNGLIPYTFNASAPREAKCCQGWFDEVFDPNDASEILKINKITAIRNMHGILNGLKRVQCLMCQRQDIGYDTPHSYLRVWERGEKVLFTDTNLEKHLKRSKVLGASVQLDFKFSSANQCKSESTFGSGVCTECAQYYYIDNDIQPKQNYTEYIK